MQAVTTTLSPPRRKRSPTLCPWASKAAAGGWSTPTILPVLSRSWGKKTRGMPGNVERTCLHLDFVFQDFIACGLSPRSLDAPLLVCRTHHNIVGLVPGRLGVPHTPLPPSCCLQPMDISDTCSVASANVYEQLPLGADKRRECALFTSRDGGVGIIQVSAAMLHTVRHEKAAVAAHTNSKTLTS